jgi:hypothetical protein
MVNKTHRGDIDRPQKIQEERFSESEIESARLDIKRAFEFCGLADGNGYPVCPKCGKTGPNRIRFYPDGGWHCFSLDNCHGNKGGAISLIVDRTGLSFKEATGVLLGREVSERTKKTKALPAPVVVKTEADDFKAAVDSTVYARLSELGSVDEAVSYYERFGVDRDAVLESGAFYITNAKETQNKLLKEFGRDRLITCGLMVAGVDDREDAWMFSDRYAVAEVHRHVKGQILGMQFRMSQAQEKRYTAHKSYSEARKASEARGETFRAMRQDERYVPKFMSLKGGSGSDHLVGMGLPRIGEITPGETVYVVEGFKDMLAMRTLGFESYALPGAGAAPPKEPARILARFNLALSFDADEGGDKGGEFLSRSLSRHGILADGAELPEDAHPWAEATRDYRAERGLKCYRKRPPAGQDVADVLAEHLATKSSTCGCRACKSYRARS